MVEVLHDRIEADSYFFIFLQIAASKLGVFLTEDQWLLGQKRGLVVQTLGVRVPPPGLEEQHQHMRNEGKVRFLDLGGHGELLPGPGRLLSGIMGLIKATCAYVRGQGYITSSLCQ